jgi:hypothetical protein
MSKRLAKVMALACRPNSVADHVALIADAQAVLRREIAQGLFPADTRQIVACPICACKFTITANSSS